MRIDMTAWNGHDLTPFWRAYDACGLAPDQRMPRAWVVKEKHKESLRLLIDRKNIYGGTPRMLGGLPLEYV